MIRKLNIRKLIKPLYDIDKEFYEWDADVILKTLDDPEVKKYYTEIGLNEDSLDDQINAIAAFINSPEIFFHSLIHLLNFCKAQVGGAMMIDQVGSIADHELFIGLRVLTDLIPIAKELNKENEFLNEFSTFESLIDHFNENDIADYILDVFEEEGFHVTPSPFHIISKYCVDNRGAAELHFSEFDPEDAIGPMKKDLINSYMEKSTSVQLELVRHVYLQTVYQSYIRNLM